MHTILLIDVNRIKSIKFISFIIFPSIGIQLL